MNKIEAMNIPSTREEFEYRFHMLSEKIRTDKFHNPSMRCLEELRLLPNGRIDILSINEQARLTANMISQFNTKRIKELIKAQDIEDPND